MKTAPNAAVAAVDWGTTRLRVWLLDRDGAVISERRSDDGMQVAALRGFSPILEENLEALGAPFDLPAIVCGMAGARQGWIEAPYVDAPARLRDVLASAVIVPDAKRSVRIVPGVAQRSAASPDVMRGEETQLAGIALRSPGGQFRVCMPGTHSKWVEIDGGVITRFGTWMTGELFAVLSQHSILRHSLAGAATSVSGDNPVFRKWLQESLSAPADLTARLFRIRASSLLSGLGADDAAAALSGLLIGAEIASAGALGTGEITLVRSGGLGDLYAEALSIAGYAIHSVDADICVLAGLVEAARYNGFLS